MSLTGKKVLLGISAGIAAYKSADLCRRLIEVGAEVQVVMTEGATRFIAPLTLQALSGRAVRTDLLDPAAEAGMGHIELARWADLILIAPATADIIARLAHGMADDLLATLCLASDKPLAIAPAMNRLMWAHPATQANCDTLVSRGVHIWGPGSGDQACGETGAGRMLEPLDLRDRAIASFASTGALAGARVLITAGPTREPVDPVRYITNRSSGKMGYALAAAAVAAGAEVTLISGPVSLPPPTGAKVAHVESAADMHAAVMEHVANADVFIACAAVADYRVVSPAANKMKKTDANMSIALTRNPDILADVSALPKPPFTVGFAAETDKVREYAEGKRKRKNIQMIAANHVGAGKGFESEQNELLVLWEGGEKALPFAHKSILASQLVELIQERYLAHR